MTDLYDVIDLFKKNTTRCVVCQDTTSVRVKFPEHGAPPRIECARCYALTELDDYEAWLMSEKIGILEVGDIISMNIKSGDSQGERIMRHRFRITRINDNGFIDLEKLCDERCHPRQDQDIPDDNN